MQDNVNQTARQLPLNFNVNALQHDLSLIASQAWQPHFNRDIYEGEWSVIPLRVIEGSHLAIYSDPNTPGEWVDTPILQSCAYLQEVLAAFSCPILSVRLLRLAPQASIKPHKDYFLGLDYGEVRLHVVLLSNPDAKCQIGGQHYSWQAGECWYGDFSQIHTFTNHGTLDRVHMVLDCKVNDWLLGLINAPNLTEQRQNQSFNHATTILNFVRQNIITDTALLEQLFALQDTDSFLHYLEVLALDKGCAFDGAEIMAALQTGQRHWIERNLPW